MKMTTRKIDSIVKKGVPGTYGDGNGLYLKLDTKGNASWVFRFQYNGKRHNMGLGSLSLVSLADARRKAEDQHRIIHDGINPLELKKARATERDGVPTFSELAKSYIESHQQEWKNAKHQEQWRRTLEIYAFPILGHKQPEDIETADVLEVLKPIWDSKPETASRVRSRIELVLDSSKALGLMQKENPARWRGHLDKLLPRHKKSRVKHLAAMPWPQLPAFWADLSNQPDSNARQALKFIILTACRSGEAVKATWDEIDFEKKLWVIPAERMKTEKPHRIPLSNQALEVLNRQLDKSSHNNRHIFPGQRNPHLGTEGVLKHVKPLGFTVHGFRSAFRDWTAEATSTPRDVAEMALAHAIGNDVEAAYRRGDLLDKRRVVMELWASFLIRGQQWQEHQSAMQKTGFSDTHLRLA